MTYSVQLENLSAEALKQVLFGKFFVLGQDFEMQDAPLRELFTEIDRAVRVVTDDDPDFAPEPDPEPEPEYDDLVAGDSFKKDDGTFAIVSLMVWVSELRVWLISTDDGDTQFRQDGELIVLEDDTIVVAPQRP